MRRSVKISLTRAFAFCNTKRSVPYMSRVLESFLLCDCSESSSKISRKKIRNESCLMAVRTTSALYDHQSWPPVICTSIYPHYTSVFFLSRSLVWSMRCRFAKCDRWCLNCTSVLILLRWMTCQTHRLTVFLSVIFQKTIERGTAIHDATALGHACLLRHLDCLPREDVITQYKIWILSFIVVLQYAARTRWTTKYRRSSIFEKEIVAIRNFLYWHIDGICLTVRFRFRWISLLWKWCQSWLYLWRNNLSDNRFLRMRRH